MTSIAIDSRIDNVFLAIPKSSSSSSRLPDLNGAVVGVESVVVAELKRRMPANSVLLCVQRFGFSANNVTYAQLGNVPHFRYFSFHDCPSTSTTSSSTYGIIPVWGFADVVAETLSDSNEGASTDTRDMNVNENEKNKRYRIEVGERLYGYLPMSRFVLLQIDAATKFNHYQIYVPRPHLPADRRPYNTLLRCRSDPQYNTSGADDEAETMLYRPLFWTSFWMADYMHTNAFWKATHVLISSASSKTAFCLAYMIRNYNQQTEAAKRVSVVGLTSGKNMDFTRRLNLYDNVISYEQLNTLTSSTAPSSPSYVYIDVASNAKFNSRLRSHFHATTHAQTLKRTVVLGMTNIAEQNAFNSSMKTSTANVSQSSSSSSNASIVETFFMVEWLSIRRRQLSIPTITNMQQHAWLRLMRDCKSWPVRIEHVRGGEAVRRAYLQNVKGQVGPEVGQIFSMWEDGDADVKSLISNSALKAKL